MKGKAVFCQPLKESKLLMIYTVAYIGITAELSAMSGSNVWLFLVISMRYSPLLYFSRCHWKLCQRAIAIVFKPIGNT